MKLQIYAHISEEVKDTFRGYDELFEQSRRLFNVEESELFKEMQKQVQIRHIFQHNRGIIRKKDLTDIGNNSPDACFNILDNERKLQSYKEGQEIWLSIPEIQKFYDTIEQYSKVFQTRAEQAQPSS